MGNTLAYASKLPTFNPQTPIWGLLCRTALGVLAASFGCAASVHVTTASALSQVTSPTTTGIAATETPGAASADALVRPTLKPGSRGAEVSELQATLKLLGFYGGSVDGVYGQTTVSAVSQFQQAAGLNADGITGPATWNRLFPGTGDLSTLPTVTSTPTTPTTNSNGSPAMSSGSASFPVPAGISPTPPSSQPTTSPRPAVKPASTKVSPTPIKPTAEPRPTASNAPTTASVSLPILKQGMRGSAVQTLQERLRSIGVFKGVSDGVFGAETLSAVKGAQRRFKLEPDGIVGGATWGALLK